VVVVAVALEGRLRLGAYAVRAKCQRL